MIKSTAHIIILALMLLLTWNNGFAEDLFQGDVYLAGTNRQELLFRQRNSISINGDTTVLRHLYTSAEGGEATVEEVTLKNGIFEKYYVDLTYSICGCALTREGNKIVFSFSRGDMDKHGEDDYTSFLVMGPTLTDFLHRQWNVLLGGETVYFHLPAMTLQRIARFQIRKLDDSSYARKGVVVLKMDIASIFLRLLVAPVELVYDLETKRLLEIHGKSLLKRMVNGKTENPVVDIYYRYDPSLR